MNRAAWFPAACLLAWAASPARAQEPSSATADGPSIETLDLQELLDTPIESVNRRAERASQAPAATFVVTREDIERQGFRTVGELLRTVPGLFLVDDSIYPQVGIRGFNLLGDISTRILVLVDGHPVNGGLELGQSLIDRDLGVNLVALERVEVIKGPMGSVYGPNAYLGLVNLVTRRADVPSADVVLSGDLEQGALRGGELNAWAGARLGGLQVGLNLGMYRSRGLDYAFPELEGQDRPTPPGGAVPGTDTRLAQNAYLTLKYGDFTLLAGWDLRFKGLPTAAFSAVLGDPGNVVRNRTGFAELSWQRQLNPVVNLFARVAYDDVHYDDDLIYPEPPEDFGPFHDLGTDRWLSAEARATFTPFQGHLDAIGLEVRNERTLMHSYYLSMPEGMAPIEKNYTTATAFLLLEQRFFDRLSVQFGLTLYAHQLFGTHLTPKMAVVWQVSPDDTLKLIYVQGLRPPSIFEAFFTDGLDYLPNERLHYESATNEELSYEHRFSEVASMTASLFRNRYLGLIGPTLVSVVENPDPKDPTDYREQYVNERDATTVHGGELSVTVRHRRWLSGYAGLSLQFPNFPDDRVSLDGPLARPGFARVTGNFALSTRALWEPLSLAVNASFVSAREQLPQEGQYATVAPYFLLNASARLEVPGVRGLAAQLVVYNLLDTVYEEPLSAEHAPLSVLRQPGRGFRVSVEGRF